MDRNKKIKVAIIVLIVLLGISLCSLAGILIYNRFSKAKPVSVVVPNNIITPKTDVTDDATSGSETSETTLPDSSEPTISGSGGEKTNSTTLNNQGVVAAALSLHKNQTADNLSFNTNNMFPGDKDAHYYCVKVSYKGTVTLRFHADIDSKSEKLSEVLKTRVVLLSTGEVLYDGLIRDMPESLNHVLSSDETDHSEIYYEVTAYLETSVGNEYMEKNLKADFRWWIEEVENLKPSPSTGDNSNIFLWFLPIISLAAALLILRKNQNKGDKQYGK